MITLATNTSVSGVGPVAGSALSTAGLPAAANTAWLSVANLSGTVRLGIEDSLDGVNFAPLQIIDLAAGATAVQLNLQGLAVGGSSQARLNVYRNNSGPFTINAAAILY